MPVFEKNFFYKNPKSPGFHFDARARQNAPRRPDLEALSGTPRTLLWGQALFIIFEFSRKFLDFIEFLWEIKKNYKEILRINLKF